MTTFEIRTENGQEFAHRAGVVPSTGRVLARNKQFLVVRWPGGKVWSGIGCPPSYHPVRTSVYAVIRTNGNMVAVRSNVRGEIEWTGR